MTIQTLSPPAAETALGLNGPGWNIATTGERAVIVLSGDWIARAGSFEADAAARIVATGVRALAFDAGRLGRWDSALILFLSALRDAAERRIAIDEAGLPPSARQLLAMTAPPPKPVRPERVALLDLVGVRALALAAATGEIVSLFGTVCLRCAAIPTRRSSLRGGDMVAAMAIGGAAALPIVTLVNFLIGAILAFVGAIQLRRFGADIYVAGLVGIAVVREMAAMMTAIIMAGRTGGAYAATIATMRANEEIDALQVVGISVMDYLVLPRILALSAMMPVLYLYGCAVAIFAGWLVAAATLNISAMSFLTELQSSVSLGQFAFGMGKSLVFGGFIALAGCHVGLRSGRSAADVGHATTMAVVAGVIGVIILDAIFALCANALDF